MPVSPIERTLNAERLERRIVAVGASVGGVHALTELFAGLPGDYTGTVLAVLHRSPHFNSELAWVLGRHSALPVREPEDMESLLPGRIYVAPRDRHLVVTEDGILRLSGGAREHFTRPAVDPLMRSVAAAFGPASVGVVLTGGGSDGLAGLVAMKAAGALALVQDPDEAVGRSMPLTSITKDHVDAVLPLCQLAPVLAALSKGESVSLRDVERAPVPGIAS